MSLQAITFFDLPLELRDLVYTYYHKPSPRTTGALQGYVELPSPALLWTCKRVRMEASSIYRTSLEAALVHENVCIKVLNKKGNVVRLAGWSKISDERFDIWINDATGDNSELGWLMSVRHIWQGGVQDAAVESSGHDILQLEAFTMKLYSQILAWSGHHYQARRRVFCIAKRVEEVAEKVQQKKRTETTTLLERCSERLKNVLSQQAQDDSTKAVVDTTTSRMQLQMRSRTAFERTESTTEKDTE